MVTLTIWVCSSLNTCTAPVEDQRIVHAIANDHLETDGSPVSGTSFGIKVSAYSNDDAQKPAYPSNVCETSPYHTTHRVLGRSPAQLWRNLSVGWIRPLPCRLVSLSRFSYTPTELVSKADCSRWHQDSGNGPSPVVARATLGLDLSVPGPGSPTPCQIHHKRQWRCHRCVSWVHVYLPVLAYVRCSLSSCPTPIIIPVNLTSIQNTATFVDHYRHLYPGMDSDSFERATFRNMSKFRAFEEDGYIAIEAKHKGWCGLFSEHEVQPGDDDNVE